MEVRLALTFWSFCLHLQRAGITVRCPSCPALYLAQSTQKDQGAGHLSSQSDMLTAACRHRSPPPCSPLWAFFPAEVSDLAVASLFAMSPVENAVGSPIANFPWIWWICRPAKTLVCLQSHWCPCIVQSCGRNGSWRVRRFDCEIKFPHVVNHKVEWQLFWTFSVLSPGLETHYDFCFRNCGNSFVTFVLVSCYQKQWPMRQRVCNAGGQKSKNQPLKLNSRYHRVCIPSGAPGEHPCLPFPAFGDPQHSWLRALIQQWHRPGCCFHHPISLCHPHAPVSFLQGPLWLLWCQTNSPRSSLLIVISFKSLWPCKVACSQALVVRNADLLGMSLFSLPYCLTLEKSLQILFLFGVEMFLFVAYGDAE